MKKVLPFCCILPAILIAISCEQEDGSKESLKISGRVVSNTSCKNLKSAHFDGAIPASQSCLEYSYNETTNTLMLKHINAGFNCCPDSLSCDVALHGDTIIISEFEKSSLCHCNCLFDVDIEVNNIQKQNYQIRLIEPYAGNQAGIIFGMNLLTEQEGSFCVSRTQYPWGI